MYPTFWDIFFNLGVRHGVSFQFLFYKLLSRVVLVLIMVVVVVLLGVMEVSVVYFCHTIAIERVTQFL